MKLHRLVTVLITQARKQSRFRHNCRLPTVAMPYCSDPVAASGATRTTAGEPARTVLASPCMPERKTKPKSDLSLRKRGARVMNVTNLKRDVKAKGVSVRLDIGG